MPRLCFQSRTCEDGGGVVFWVEGAESLSGELVLDVEVVRGLAVLVDGGICPAERAEAVRAADQHVGGIGLRQDANVVLAFVLKKEKRKERT